MSKSWLAAALRTGSAYSEHFLYGSFQLDRTEYTDLYQNGLRHVCREPQIHTPRNQFKTSHHGSKHEHIVHRPTQSSHLTNVVFMINVASMLRGAWKRACATHDVQHIFTFVDIPNVHQSIDACRVKAVRRVDGAEIKDPTPWFSDEELSVVLNTADKIATLLKSGSSVLVVCRGGKNRSAFLAHLASARAGVPPPSKRPVDERMCEYIDGGTVSGVGKRKRA